MSLGRYVLIDPAELPTEKELLAGIRRLRKDAVLLGQFRNRKDEDPVQLNRAANFLEAVITMAGNKLKKEPKEEVVDESE